MKVQDLTLPNGLFGSVYVGVLRVSDSGLLNTSGLDAQLSGLFEFNMNNISSHTKCPAVYGDRISNNYPQLLLVIQILKN